MLILIRIPTYKHMILSIIFVIGKIRILEFHQPPPLHHHRPKTLKIPPTHTATPKFRCRSEKEKKNMRYRFNIDNIKPFGNPKSCQKELLEKITGGVATTPFGGRGLSKGYILSTTICQTKPCMYYSY